MQWDDNETLSVLLSLIAAVIACLISCHIHNFGVKDDQGVFHEEARSCGRPLLVSLHQIEGFMLDWTLLISFKHLKAVIEQVCFFPAQ